MTAHPAKFSAALLEVLEPLVGMARRVLDPFAGTGLVHRLHPNAWGVELEPEWAAMHPRTVVGDATRLPFANASFDLVVTSPTYGNRMADHHNARDASRRNTYRHTLGRPLHPRNSGRMQWGAAYRELHREAWGEAWRVLEPDGRLILNLSDHIRAGAVVPVTAWHLATCLELGFQLLDETRVVTPRNRNGANAHLRVDHESVLELIKPLDMA